MMSLPDSLTSHAHFSVCLPLYAFLVLDVRDNDVCMRENEKVLQALDDVVLAVCGHVQVCCHRPSGILYLGTLCLKSLAVLSGHCHVQDTSAKEVILGVSTAGDSTSAKGDKVIEAVLRGESKAWICKVKRHEDAVQQDNSEQLSKEEEEQAAKEEEEEDDRFKRAQLGPVAHVPTASSGAQQPGATAVGSRLMPGQVPPPPPGLPPLPPGVAMLHSFSIQ